MKTIIDHQKMRQRVLLSNAMSIGGLLALLASVLLPIFIPGVARYYLVLLATGLGISMVGIYFANRWVRRPRPEEKLDTALKSLNDGYHLYHYPSLPCDHVLLTPGGLVVLETIGLGGVFSYKDGKWKESMTIGRALRYIVEEHLGDPIKAARSAEAYLRENIAKQDIPVEKLVFKSIVVFIHPFVDLDINNPSIPVVKIDKLRKHIPTGTMKMDDTSYQTLDEWLSKLTIKV
jgi:hypothetical protein